MENHRENIFLIGFMGVGKSTIAARLGERLGEPVVEMDQVIVNQQDMEISDIFAEYGENYFRKLETDLLEELSQKRGQIVSCGGGAVVKEENVHAMKRNGRIILLTAEPETIFGRVKDSADRPILQENMSVDYIEELMEERREKYWEAADFAVTTDRKSIDQIADEICAKLEQNR